MVPLSPNLGYLNLSLNSFEDTAPAATEGLVVVDLSNNKFNGSIPESYTDHPNMRLLDLARNLFGGIPKNWEPTGDALAQDPPLSRVFISNNPLKVSSFECFFLIKILMKFP